MRLSYLVLLLASFGSSVQANESSCLTQVVDGTDYFPNKVTPEYSKKWSVVYEDTYKIVTNVAVGESYLLYQCGTEPPSDQLDGRHAGMYSVPLDGVGLLYTTMIPFLEILGARDKIVAYLGSASWISSPCVRELVDEGKVDDVPDPYNATDVETVPLDLPSFVGTTETTAFTNQIRDASSEEDDNLATFEWIKFYSLFLNLEETANKVFNATAARYKCAEDNAALLACGDETKPVVLWASYSTYCGGWDVATCPNYYCEFAESCQAKLLSSDTQGSYYSEACYRNYMTTEEFIQFGRDADIWIYTSSDFDNTYATFSSNLTDFKSVQNQQVFDTEGGGSGMWFEQRLAEPDVVLQDFCNIVGRDESASLSVSSVHQRAWFRNVFSEPVGSVGQCQDVNAPLVPQASECVALPSSYCEGSKTPTDGSGNSGNESSTSNGQESSAATTMSRMMAFLALIAFAGF